MAQQAINLSAADDGLGTNFRAGGDMINQNFTELYALQSQTINAGATQFTGSTEEKINAAITYAVSTGRTTVFIPKTLLPYNPSLVTFAATVRMVREGGNWDTYDIKAYGAYGDGTTDDTVALTAAVTAAKNNANGGTVWCPADRYKIVNFNLGLTENNVLIKGETPYGAFNGTVFYCPSGGGANWCVWIHYVAALHSDSNACGFDSIQFESNGTSEGTGAEYGVIISTNLASLVNCSVTNFQYGLTGWGWNQNRFDGCRFTNNTRAGVVLLDTVSLSYQAPTLYGAAVITADELAVVSALFHMSDCRIRVNQIGAIFRNAIEGTIDETVFESNYHQAIVLWDCRNMLFNHIYLENNNRTAPATGDVTNYNALKSSASIYLNGSVNGAYGSNDLGHDILIGETTESSSSVIPEGHACRWNFFSNLSHTQGANTVKAFYVRAGYQNACIRPQIKGEGNVFFGASAASVITIFDRPLYRVYGNPNSNVIDHTLGTKTRISEGSWTPVWSTDTPGGSCTYSRQNGKFRMDVWTGNVTAQYDVKISANNLSGSGTLRMTGLPYTCAVETGAQVGYWDGMATNWTNISATMGGGGTSFAMYGVGAAAAAMTALARTDLGAAATMQGVLTYQVTSP